MGTSLTLLSTAPLYSLIMKPQIKLSPRARVTQILTAALTLAPSVGYMKLTRDEVAEHLGISSSLIPHHMGTMAVFRRRIMREAVRTECLPVIAQGIAAQDPQALKASPTLRLRALNSLSK